MMVENCPCCNAPNTKSFYELNGAPVHSVLLMTTREAAVSYPRRDIVLRFCRQCGFIFNALFDPTLHDYSTQYEETQGYSATFGAFQRRLAESLIERHRLRGKRIVEIGCGKGEFLSLLCELGNNRGIGFDPGYIPERNRSNAKDNIQFIPAFFENRNDNLEADFICCWMTLEHIHRPALMLETIRRSITDRTVVFFQVPDVARILNELAFWDIYYEHCNYFSGGSLARLFKLAGFEVLACETVFDGQYVAIDAKLGGKAQVTSDQSDIESLSQAVERFAEGFRLELMTWRRRVSQWSAAGKRVVVWGSGSKGVTFLNALHFNDEVACAVDINPYRQGTWMPGSGHPIVAPSSLPGIRPDVVVIMNRVYRPEIELELRHLALTPEIFTL
jgi:2-polyprenyl-3-methyl-5-hydroxy-6-metoxy-1,4-benzoquinol methylase